MTIPLLPRVVYAQTWRRIDGKGDDAEWHVLHPLGLCDSPIVSSVRPEPDKADRRYEVRVVRYVLDEEGLK